MKIRILSAKIILLPLQGAGGLKGHGGTITIDTKEGEYTEFTIMLPIN